MDRAAQFAELLERGGHSIVTNPADAEIVFLVQRAPGELPVTRHEAVEALFRVAPEFKQPCVVCLVSLEPNTVWPVGMCHVVRTNLQFNAAQACSVTRAHFNSFQTPNFDKLIVGARENAVAAMEEVFTPLLPAGCTLRVANLYEAERDAHYRPDQA